MLEGVPLPNEQNYVNQSRQVAREQSARRSRDSRPDQLLHRQLRLVLLSIRKA